MFHDSFRSFDGWYRSALVKHVIKSFHLDFSLSSHCGQIAGGGEAAPATAGGLSCHDSFYCLGCHRSMPTWLPPITPQDLISYLFNSALCCEIDALKVLRKKLGFTFYLLA